MGAIALALYQVEDASALCQSGRPDLDSMITPGLVGRP